MKSYEEISETLFKRRDIYIEEQRVRRMAMKKTIKRTLTSLGCVALAVALGIGAWQAGLFKKPEISAPQNDISSSKEESIKHDNAQETTPPAANSEEIIPPDNSDYYPDYIDIGGAGGDGGWWYDTAYNAKFSYFGNQALRNIVKEIYGEEVLEKWLKQFWGYDKLNYTRLDGVNDIKVIDEFNITKEQFVSYCERNNLIVDGKYFFDEGAIWLYEDGYEDPRYEFNEYYTQEEVDILFGEDKTLRDETFVNNLGIFSNGKAYSPRWVCEHKAEDYIAAGMTKEQIKEKLELWKNEETPITCDYNIDNFVYSHDKFKKMLADVEKELERWEDALVNPSTEKSVDNELRLRYPNRRIIPSILSLGNWVFNKYKFGYIIEADLKGLREIYGKDLVDEWVSQFYFYGGKRDIQEITLMNFFVENNISKEDAYACYDDISSRAFQLSRDKFDIVLSGDTKLINETFVSPMAICVNGEIYTPDWINNHTANDYINAGISKQELLEKVAMWKKDTDVCEYFLDVDNIEAEIAKMP